MRGAWRLFVAAFLTDSALYLAFAALPFRAIELGAGPSRLGILPTLYAGAYMSCASVAGRLSDRMPRLALARVACAVFVLGCAVHVPIGLRSVVAEWFSWRGPSRDLALVAFSALLAATGMRAVIGLFA